VELLLAHALGVDRYDLYTKDLSPLLGKEVEEHFWFLVERRKSGESVAYITGEKEFWSMSFRVGKGCLVPRPETEILVEEALEFIKRRKAPSPLTILDVGTGSGCIGVALAMELLKAAYGPFNIVGIDVSPQALRYARENCLRYGLKECVHLVHGDWLAPFKPGSFDLIVTNPPYIPLSDYNGLSKEVRLEPREALIAGRDGLSFIHKTLMQGPGLLRKGGAILMEIGVGQVPSILTRLRADQDNFKKVSVARDLAGVERILILET